MLLVEMVDKVVHTVDQVVLPMHDSSYKMDG